MSHSRPLVIVALCVVVIGLAGAMGALLLDPARAAVGPLPAEGLVLPADARFVAGLDVRRLIEGPHYQKLVENKQNKRLEALQELEDATGLNPERDVDQIVIAGGHDGNGGRNGAFLILGRFDSERLAQAIEEKVGVSPVEHAGSRIYVWSEKIPLPSVGEATASQDAAVAFLDDRVVVVGSRAAVEAIASVRAAGGTPLRENEQMMALLEQVRPGSTFWMVGDRTLLSEMPKALGAGSGPAMNLPALQSLIVTGDIDPALSLQLIGEARDAEAANNLADIVRGIAAIAALQAGQQPELKELASAVSVTTHDSRVRVNVRITWELIEGLTAKFTSPKRDAGEPGGNEAAPGAPPAS